MCFDTPVHRASRLSIRSHRRLNRGRRPFDVDEHGKARSVSRTTVVIVTHNRAPDLCRTLDELTALPQRPPIIVVDNASTDGTAQRLATRFPAVTVLRMPRNLGAVARNHG